MKRWRKCELVAGASFFEMQGVGLCVLCDPKATAPKKSNVLSTRAAAFLLSQLLALDPASTQLLDFEDFLLASTRSSRGKIKGAVGFLYELNLAG